MDITPLHPLFVGEVTGLDLRDEMDELRLAELTSALAVSYTHLTLPTKA